MHAGNVRFTPACRQFLCTHRDLRTCYRRAEKRCWVRDSCKPPGCTSPPRLHQPPHACPAQPSIHPSFSRTFPLSLSPSLPPSFHPLLQNPTSLCLPSFATRLLRMDFSYHFSFFFFPGHRSHPSFPLVDFLVSFLESFTFSRYYQNYYTFYYIIQFSYYISSSFFPSTINKRSIKYI